MSNDSVGPTEGAFYYLPWRRRQFKLAGTCQLVPFDPTLLRCAKKRRVEPPEEVAQRKPFGRVSLTLSETKGRGPFEILKFRICSAFKWGNLLRILEALSFWLVSTYWFAR